MKISLLINMKMPTSFQLAFSYLLAEKFSCSAIVTKKEFAIVSNLRFIRSTFFMLSWVEHEKSFITSGPKLQCQKMYFWTCASSKDSDQPAHSCSLIRIFTEPRMQSFLMWTVKTLNSLHRCMADSSLSLFVFVLRFYCPVNPVGSCPVVSLPNHISTGQAYPLSS